MRRYVVALCALASPIGLTSGKTLGFDRPASAAKSDPSQPQLYFKSAKP